MDNGNNVNIKIVVDTKEAVQNLDKINKSTEEYNDTLDETNSRMSKTFDGRDLIAWIGTIKNYGSAIMRLSSKQTAYIESVNLLNVAYGELNNSGVKLVKNLSEITGIDASNLTASLATYRQLATSLNIASEAATTMSENLLQMSLDISSLYNLDIETTNTKLIRAITGQSRAVKILGADVTDAGLQQMAYNLGLDRSVKSMTQAEKTILRYITVQNQLNNSQGDYNKTMNSVAQQTKLMNEQITTLLRQLGGLFVPILQTILPLLNGILMTINSILGVVLGLLGIDAVSLGNDLGLAANSILEYDESAQSAIEDTEALKTSLRGFDKLNVIKTPSSSDTGSTGVGISSDMLDLIKQYNSQLDEANNKASEIRDNIMEWAGFTKDGDGNWKLTNFTLGTAITIVATLGLAFLAIYKIIKTISGVKNILSGIIGKTGRTTEKGISSFKLPNAKTILQGLADLALIVGGCVVLVLAIGELMKIPTFKEATTTGIETLVEVFKGVGKILIPLAGLTALTYLTSLAKGMISGMADLALIISGITGLVVIIGGLVNLVSPNIIETGINAVVTVFEGISKILLPLLGLELLAAVTSIGAEIIIPGLGILAVIILATTAFFEAIGAIMSVAPGEELISKGIDTLCLVFEGIGRITGSLIGGIAEGVIDAVANTLPNLGLKLSEFMTNAKPFFEGLSGITSDSTRAVQNIAECLIILTSNNILQGLTSWFAGEASLEDFGKDLSAFAPYFADYAKKISGINADVVNSSANAAMSLSELNKSLPKDNGTWQKWFGNKSLSNFGEQLPNFGKNLKAYADNVKGLDTGVVENSANAAKSIAELNNNLPKSDGWWQSFVGEKSLSKFGEDLKSFGKSFKTYAGYVKEIDFNIVNASISSISNIVNELNNIKDNGLTNVLKNFSNQFKSSASAIKDGFSSMLNWSTANSIGVSFGYNLGQAIIKGFKQNTFPTLKLTSTSNGMKLDSYKLSAYAQGGFPEVGQLFMARENGKPEMVGNIGSKTAVANNDQIVEAISVGVAKAMMASGEKNTNVNIIAEGDASGLLDFITFKKQQQNRQYGF